MVMFVYSFQVWPVSCVIGTLIGYCVGLLVSSAFLIQRIQRQRKSKAGWTSLECTRCRRRKSSNEAASNSCNQHWTARCVLRSMGWWNNENEIWLVITGLSHLSVYFCGWLYVGCEERMRRRWISVEWIPQMFTNFRVGRSCYDMLFCQLLNHGQWSMVSLCAELG